MSKTNKNADADHEPNYFDKFMENICEDEDKLKAVEVVEDTPGMRYAKRYRENHLNRTMWKRGG